MAFGVSIPGVLVVDNLVREQGVLLVIDFHRPGQRVDGPVLLHVLVFQPYRNA